MQTDCQRTDMTDNIKTNSNVRLGKPSISDTSHSYNKNCNILSYVLLSNGHTHLVVTLIQWLEIEGEGNFCHTLPHYANPVLCSLLCFFCWSCFHIFQALFMSFFLTIPCCNSFLQMSLDLNWFLFLHTYKGNKHFYLPLTWTISALLQHICRQ